MQYRGEAVSLVRFWGVDNSLPAALNHAYTHSRIIKPVYFLKSPRDGWVNQGISSTAFYLVLSVLILTLAVIICFLVMSSMPVQATDNFVEKYHAN